MASNAVNALVSVVNDEKNNRLVFTRYEVAKTAMGQRVYLTTDDGLVINTTAELKATVPALADMTDADVEKLKIQNFWTKSLAVAPAKVVIHIVKQPENISMAAAEELNVAITVDTPGVAYQWQRADAEAGPYQNITGATSAAYNKAAGNVTTADAGYYRVHLTLAGSDAVDSSASHVTVNP